MEIIAEREHAAAPRRDDRGLDAGLDSVGAVGCEDAVLQVTGRQGGDALAELDLLADAFLDLLFGAFERHAFEALEDLLAEHELRLGDRVHRRRQWP